MKYIRSKVCGNGYMTKWFLLIVAAGLIFSTSTALATDDAVVESLPFGKQWVIDQGFGEHLPLPMGVAWNFAWIKQDLDLVDISLTSSPEDPLHDTIEMMLPIIDVVPDVVWAENYASNFKFDVWLTPMLNLYAMVGYIEGESAIEGSTVIPTSGLDELSAEQQADMLLLEFMLNATATGAMPGDPDYVTFDDPGFLPLVTKVLGVSFDTLMFGIDITGYSYGVGLTFAGGYPVNYGAIDSVFFAFDTNYTKAELDVADSEIKSLTFAPRLGIVTSALGLPLSVYVGAMKMDMTQSMSGWVNYSGVEVFYETVQESIDPWNYLFGVRLDLTRHFKFTLEGGFGKREHIIGSAEYRF